MIEDEIKRGPYRACWIDPFTRLDVGVTIDSGDGIAQKAFLNRTESKDPLEDTGNFVSVLDRLHARCSTGRGLQWVERQPLRAHVDHIDAERFREIRATIVRLKVEDSERQTAATACIDQHPDCLGLTGAGVSRDQDTEIIEMIGRTAIRVPFNDGALE